MPQIVPTCVNFYYEAAPARIFTIRVKVVKKWLTSFKLPKEQEEALNFEDNLRKKKGKFWIQYLYFNYANNKPSASKFIPISHS